MRSKDRRSTHLTEQNHSNFFQFLRFFKNPNQPQQYMYVSIYNDKRIAIARTTINITGNCITMKRQHESRYLFLVPLISREKLHKKCILSLYL